MRTCPVVWLGVGVTVHQPQQSSMQGEKGELVDLVLEWEEGMHQGMGHKQGLR